jgi:hypothetical protein
MLLYLAPVRGIQSVPKDVADITATCNCVEKAAWLQMMWVPLSPLGQFHIAVFVVKLLGLSDMGNHVLAGATEHLRKG